MKLIVADDHAIVRAGVKHYLEKHTHHQVVAEVCCASKLKQQVSDVDVEALVLDYRMPGGDSFAVADALKRRTELKVLIYTACDSAVLMEELYLSRIDGVVLKKDPTVELVNALAAIEAGEKYYSPSVRTIVEACSVHLTARELQILNMILMGFSRSLIAEQLCISPETVKSHRKNLMRKLDVQNVTELVNRAQELSLCSG